MDPSPSSISQKQHTLFVTDSVISSPRYHYHNETADLLLIPHVPGSKLRLMCSYGGHIMPRDSSLYYVGGDTRIVAVDRHSSLTHLFSHLSRTLLHGRRPFTLKYHLPNEDLDNLITVSTDEDLQNMIDEYDRLSSNPSRLRLFLFFSKPDTAVSMGNDHFHNHAWFVEALNNSGILSRVVSDSAAVVDNCLLNLDDYDVSASSNDENANNVNKEHLIDVDYSVPVDKEEENMFNYSIANLRVSDEERVMIEQQDKKQDDDLLVSSSYYYAASAGAGDDFNDDRKPPLPSLILQPKTAGAGLGLPSPDSTASDSSSITSANSLSKTVVYNQDLVQTAHVDNKVTSLPNSIKSEVCDQNHQEEQVKNSTYTSPQQQPSTYQQHQFVYIHHPIGTSQVPVSSSYYPYYVMPSNSAFVQIPSNQFQQQYVSLPQNQNIQHPPRPIYSYEYGGATQDQVYYTQQQHANAPLQYQSMTPAPASATLSDVSKQIPIDNNIQQQNRTSQQV